jgi:uncharacterized protein YgbK (DUF1537 family)
VLRSAGVEHLRVTGELEPGIVRAHVVQRGLEVVTKAGAFGDRDALLRCLRDTAARARSTQGGRTP